MTGFYLESRGTQSYGAKVMDWERRQPMVFASRHEARAHRDLISRSMPSKDLPLVVVSAGGAA